MKSGSGKKWVFLPPVREKSGNSQGILIHVLGMNPVIKVLIYSAKCIIVLIPQFIALSQIEAKA